MTSVFSYFLLMTEITSVNKEYQVRKKNVVRPISQYLLFYFQCYDFAPIALAILWD